MEKKMLKLICAGLAVILLLAAGVIILNNQTAETVTGVKIFADKAPSDILELKIQNSSGSYSVYYDESEDGYVFDDIPAGIIDIDGFFALMEHSCGFGSLRLVKEHADNLSLYGLDDPAAIISVAFRDGQTFSMAVGDKEKVSGNYYGSVLSDDEKDNVYIFAAEDMAYFLLKKESYISYQVTPELNVSSPLSAVRDITFSGSALSDPVSVTAVTSSDMETYLAARSFGPATHIVRMDGVYELDQTYGIEILGSVLGIRALDIAGYNVSDEELSALGFDDPYMQVDFSLKNGTEYIADYQLKLVPSGQYYLAYTLGSGVVYVIEPPAFISLDRTKLCLRWFLSPLRTDLADLTVEFDGETYIYTSGTDEDGTIFATVNETPLDRELFFSFYRLVTGASSEGVYLENPVNTGDPVMIITYNYNIEGKEPDVMKLYEGSLRRVNVEINGITEFDMKASFVDAVKTACHNTLTGDKIEENW